MMELNSPTLSLGSGSPFASASSDTGSRYDT